MLIQCTKKLLDELNIKPSVTEGEEPLFSWHANLIKVNRKKTVVLVNDKNRYNIVLYGLKAKDFKNLDAYITQAIRETFWEECIDEEIIEKFIKQAGEVVYTKTKDKSSVARMNKSCEMADAFEDLIQEGSVNQSNMNLKISTLLAGRGNEYIHPNEELYKDLEAFAGGPVFNCKAVQLKVTLDLENYNVWRRITVPVNTTFYKLHRILQVVFGWEDRHLHEFYIYVDEKFDKNLSVNHSGSHKESYKPVVKLVCEEEAFDYPDDEIPMKLETGIRLSDYIPAKMKYNYDFGDNWQHYIDVERIVENYDKNHAVCIEGEGISPPEDVGGERGYEEFLEAIADEKHLDHEHMLAWGKSQGYESFDLDMVNNELRIVW